MQIVFLFFGVFCLSKHHHHTGTMECYCTYVHMTIYRKWLWVTSYKHNSAWASGHSRGTMYWNFGLDSFSMASLKVSTLVQWIFFKRRALAAYASDVMCCNTLCIFLHFQHSVFLGKEKHLAFKNWSCQRSLQIWCTKSVATGALHGLHFAI